MSTFSEDPSPHIMKWSMMASSASYDYWYQFADEEEVEPEPDPNLLSFDDSPEWGDE